MSDKVWFDPTSDKWALSDGEHYLEVQHWAREIIADEFERETRQLNAENAALREECDGWKKMCVDQEVMHVMHEEMLDNENAKLRELVDYMTPIAWYAASECERDRMRELGVDE